MCEEIQPSLQESNRALSSLHSGNSIPDVRCCVDLIQIDCLMTTSISSSAESRLTQQQRHRERERAGAIEVPRLYLLGVPRIYPPISL